MVSIPAENQKQILANLTELGSVYTFRRPAASVASYDPATGAVTPATGEVDQDETVIGVFLNYRDRDLDGELIQRGDRVFAMAATYAGSSLAKTPQMGDQIRGEADPVTVVDVRTVKGGSSVIGYLLQVRE